MSPTGSDVALATVSRDGVIESTHYGRAATCGPDGLLHSSTGDPGAMQFWRSSSKPLQALSVVTSGAADKFGLTEKELSICCASHCGSAEHVETVSGILAKLDVDASALNCGAHWPGDVDERNRLIAAGEEPSQLHNNCSGKHAGMLATTRALGAPIEGYLAFDHPVQRLIAAHLSLFSGVPETDFIVGRDGCGAPTVAMPLRNMAGAFAMLALPDGLPGEIASAAEIVRHSTSVEPGMVSSHGSFNSELLRLGGGDLVAKGGAEGLFCVASHSRGLGIAVKVSDGSNRPHPPTIIALMRAARIEVPAELAERFERIPVTNCHSDTVGQVEVAQLDLQQMA